MITHLVDTDICIEALRRRDRRLAARFIEADASLSVSAVTVSELLYGAARSSDPARNRSAVEEFLAMVAVLDLDATDASAAAEVRAELAAAGRPIGGYDVLIAGQARARSLVVASGNVREFGRVEGLRVEDWRGPG
ncbi:type II toxin-antitoxin system VapC family toxin [Nocardioides sp. BGMRC 2183]|nr:type II toxin-antitoxin system VapC family toxin [Nocardioides sp. BGMRC 2183]